MNRITLLFVVLYLLTVLVCVSSKPFHQSEEEQNIENKNSDHTVEKRSIFGLSAFVLTLLNTILAVSLNSSINTQNAEHGGIVG